MKLTEKQIVALHGIVSGVRGGTGQIKLGGFAGTGKSVLVSYLTKFFPSFAVAAYTGKAANVLRKKSIPATTIHSRIYKPFFDNGVVYFDLTPDPGCDGFIIDEASMVSRDIYDDLCKFGLPLVFVGDHGQLEPVDSNFNLMEKPDYALVEIHRNAGDIAKFAEHLRNGYAPRGFQCRDGGVEFVNCTDIDTLSSVDQVICAFNKTRVEVNNLIRTHKKYKGLVCLGEKVMCLRNNRKYGLFNGMQGTVVKLTEGKYGRKYMDFQFDDDLLEGIWYDPGCFGKDTYKFKIGQDTPNPFDYAHCITCHKCVHPDTLMETSEGLLPIHAVANEGSVATPSGAKHYNNLVVNGENDGIRLVTEHGYEITMTPEHRVEYWDGEQFSMTTADKLGEGQFVRLKKGMTIDPTAATIPEIPEGDIRAKVVNSPKMSGDLAEFFGLMVADGTVYKSGFRLAKRHEDVLVRFEYLCNNLFGCHPRRITIGKTGAVEVSSIIVAGWLKMIGGMNPNEKMVPDCILRSPSSIHRAFLRGLMEDGTVVLKQGKSDHIEFSCHVPKLLGVARTMLLRQNIVTSSAVNKLYIYGKNAVNFREGVGFISSFKQDRLWDFQPVERYSVIPVSKEETALLKKYLSTSDMCNVRQRGYISRTKMPQLPFLIERAEYHHDRILTLEKTTCQSMCVTVPDGNRFLQNGFPFWNSQGDEFSSVLVIEQKCKNWEHKRWAYTAASRAKEKLKWKPGY